MKRKELLKRLHEIQRHKSDIKKLAQTSMDIIQKAFDKTHELETAVLLLIQELDKKK